MANVYARLVAALKSAADASGDLLERILLGTPGTLIEYPAPEPLTEKVTQTYDSGGHWSQPYLPALLEGLGNEMDRALIVSGLISTNASGAAPNIMSGTLLASASKNEGTDILTVNFSSSFTVAPYFATGTLFLCGVGIPEVYSRTVGSVSMRWYNAGGGVININDLYVMFLACGAG